MDFEWDPRKAETNLRKHGVSFNEAATIFGDELAMTVPDPDRDERIRIISARELTRTERKAYEEEI